MTSGCAHGSAVADKPAPVARVAPDTTAMRCPAATTEQRRILTARVQAPKPDRPDGLSAAALKTKTDELRLDADAKGKVGLAIADELDRCRGVAPSGT